MSDVFDRMHDALRAADDEFEDAQYASDQRDRMTAAPTGPDPRTDAAVGR